MVLTYFDHDLPCSLSCQPPLSHFSSLKDTSVSPSPPILLYPSSSLFSSPNPIILSLPSNPFFPIPPFAASHFSLTCRAGIQ